MLGTLYDKTPMKTIFLFKSFKKSKHRFLLDKAFQHLKFLKKL